MNMVRPNMDNNLQALVHWGDPIEREIIKDSELLSVVTPYAAIWAKHILSRRDNEHRYVTDDLWYRFGAHHYTALIRVHNARQSLAAIATATKVLAGNQDAVHQLLALHLAIASFWESLGSAIENLERALASVVPGAKVDRLGALGKAHRQRSRLIHGLVVPVGVDRGSVEFMVSHLEDEDDKKGWAKPEKHTTDWVFQHHESEWMAVRAALASEWWKIVSQLEDLVKPPVDVVYFANTLPKDVMYHAPALSGTYLPPTTKL